MLRRADFGVGRLIGRTEGMISLCPVGFWRRQTLPLALLQCLCPHPVLDLCGIIASVAVIQCISCVVEEASPLLLLSKISNIAEATIKYEGSILLGNLVMK